MRTGLNEMIFENVEQNERRKCNENAIHFELLIIFPSSQLQLTAYTARGIVESTESSNRTARVPVFLYVESSFWQNIFFHC